MEAPPPWLSPDLSVWAAMVAPCEMVWRSFIALAQAGWPASAGGGDGGGVFGPGEILPPVLVIAARLPSRNDCFMPSPASESGQPAWAKAMKDRQTIGHGATIAAHTLKAGDSHGGGTSIDTSEKD